jgi:hypothetical protein
MNHKIMKTAVFAGILLAFLPIAVYANSSWHWVTTSPFTVLPFAVIATLLIEKAAVVKIGKVPNSRRTLIIICAANLLSFIAPYLERAYRFIPTSGEYAIMAAFNKGPFYIVLSGYLILTVIVELPLVFYLLREESANKKNLFMSILLSNTVTTLLVAVLERIICIGRW